MLLKIFLIWCVVYTIADLIHWAYYYFKRYRNRNKTIIDDTNVSDQHKPFDQYKTFTLQENTSEDTVIIDEADFEPKFNVLTPEMFKSTVSRISQESKSQRRYSYDEFYEGRRLAYCEILNVIERDFKTYDVEYRWNYNMPHHAIDKILKMAILASAAAKEHNNDNYFKGREAAYFEVIDVIAKDFMSYGVNLEEYGLTRFKRD